MITLYLSPGACSLAPHIALEEAGATFEAKVVNMRKGEHKAPDFLKVNPNGQVPAMVVDGVALNQNVALLTYIARAYPAANLLPVASPLEEAQALSFAAWLSSSVHIGFGRQFGVARMVEDEVEKGKFVAKAKAICEDCFKRIDETLAGKDWVLGSFSILDCYLVPFYHWAKHFLGYDLSAFANYTAHYERMMARPAVQRVMAREAELAKSLEG